MIPIVQISSWYSNGYKVFPILKKKYFKVSTIDYIADFRKERKALGSGLFYYYALNSFCCHCKCFVNHKKVPSISSIKASTFLHCTTLGLISNHAIYNRLKGA